MKDSQEFEDIIDVINAHQRFIISSHINPEGDSLGSQLAFLEVLESMNKEVFVINAHTVPDRYKFMPNNDKIISLKEYNIMTGGKNNPEVIFLLDCPSVERIGKVKKIIKEDSVLANVDHHTSNSYFGQANYVDDLSSSTCQILFELFQQMNAKLNKSISINLYTGILMDTGGFKHSNTSSKTHIIASQLLREGVKADIIFQSLYEQWPIERLKLLSKVLGSIGSEFEGQFIFITLLPEMLKETGADRKLSEDFINYCLTISGAKVAAFFRVDSKYIKINFRSRELVDVNKIASKYGGGGHVRASGCSIEGDFEEVKDKIKRDIKEVLYK